jgi:peptide/nickel transport system substrate-binding protein
MSVKLRTLTLLSASLASTLLASAALRPAVAVDFKWANDGDVGAMDPYTRQETVQLSFLSNIYEPMVRWNRDLKLEPALATSWEQTSPTVWRFHLRPGVKWQDGSAFTADDVIFSLQRILDKNSVMRAVMGPVKEARKVDDLTVDFETKQPDPIFLQEQTNFLIMSKAWATAHDATSPVLTDASKAENFAVRNAMGTGPFKLTIREPDRRTVVDKNPAWWDKPQGNVDHVEFDVIGNAATRTAALLSGGVDMIYAVPPQDMERIEHTQGLKLLQKPELRTIYLGMDSNRPELLKSTVKGKNPFKDVRVRRAFALAIDENAIAARVMRGQAHPTWLMYGPGVNGYDAKMDVRPKVDVAEAKKLLADAGYPDGFGVTLDCSNDRYVNDEAICTAIVSMLARIGVKVDLNAQTKSKFFGDINTPKFNTSFFMLGWTPATYDAHNALSTLLGTRNGTRGEVNDGGYSNPNLDTLIDQIGTETDQAKRNGLIDQAAKIVQDDVADIPLHQQVIVWASKSNIDVAQMADNYFPYRYVTVK